LVLKTLLEDEQRAKCGGVCWQSLSTKSNHQLRSKKEGNYMFSYTNTFTIDIVPFVLENYYFAGLIIGYKGIIVKICLWTKHKVDSVQGKR